MFSKSYTAFLFIFCLNLGAVDFNPLSSHKKIALDFDHGMEFAQVSGSARNEKNSFIGGGLILDQCAVAKYGIPCPQDLKDFTFWMFFNTNNIGNNTHPVILTLGKDSLTLGFHPETGSPFLKYCENGRERSEFQSSVHIDGETWRMFGIRKKGTKCELLLNGVSIGSLEVSSFGPGKSLVLTLAGETTKDVNHAFNRYDNLFFYDLYFDDSTLKIHYADEIRTHMACRKVKTLPRKEPEHNIYEFDSSNSSNALPNGSFEYGMKGWHLEGPAGNNLPKESLGDRMRIASSSPDGKFKLVLEGNSTILYHYPLFVRKSGEFTISFLARSRIPGSSLTLRLKRLNTFAVPRSCYEKTFRELTRDFACYSVSGNLPEDAKGVFLEFESSGTVELDAVQFRGGGMPCPKYETSGNVLMVETGKPYNVFFDDEPLNFHVYRSKPETQGILSIYDEKDRLVFQHPIPPGITELAVPFQRKGAFRAVIRSGGRVTDEQLFSRLCTPLKKEGEIPSRYGSHYHNTPFSLGFAKAIGSHWNRNHDSGPYVARWDRKTKPADGNFKYCFDLFELNRENGQTLIATLIGPWKEEETTPEEFGKNVGTLVKNYKGKLKYIEIFNEPTAWFPPKRYAEFLKEAYKQAKAVDPEVKILGLSTWDVVADFTRTAVEAAGCENMDIFSTHFYNWGAGAWLIPDGSWGQGFRMRKLRNYLNTRPGGRDLPIWHTESGIYMDSFFFHHPLRFIDTQYTRASSYPHHPPYLGAIWMAQAFPVNFANGAQVFTYYAWGPTVGGILRMNGHNMGEIDGSPKPSAAAFSASAHFLDFSKFIRGIDDLDPNGIRAFQFQRNGRNTVVAWTQRPEPLYLKTFPSAVFDYMGNKVEPSQLSGKAFLNFNGVQKEVEVPLENRGRFFLDLEPKYLPDMTLDEFVKLLPEKVKTYSL